MYIGITRCTSRLIRTQTRHTQHNSLSLVSLSQFGNTHRARIVGLDRAHWAVGMMPRILRSALLGATKRSTSKFCRKTGGLPLSSLGCSRNYPTLCIRILSVLSGNTLPVSPEPGAAVRYKTWPQFVFLHTTVPVFVPYPRACKSLNTEILKYWILRLTTGRREPAVPPPPLRWVILPRFINIEPIKGGKIKITHYQLRNIFKW